MTHKNNVIKSIDEVYYSKATGERIMELDQLKCFLAVVDEGSFNRATTRRRITPPAIARQIKQLEAELGVPLLQRRDGGVRPTEAGRVLARHVRRVVESVRTATRAVEDLSDDLVGEIRIGTVNSVGIHFLPNVLRSIRERYPSIRLSLLYRSSGEILKALAAGEVDLALVVNPRSDKRLRMETIIEERISLVCGQSHRLFNRSTVSPGELKEHRFISLSGDNPTSQLIREHLVRLGVRKDPVVSTDDVETIKKMVETGLGVAFLPDMVTASGTDSDGSTTGKLARIRTSPPLYRKIVLVTWKNCVSSRAVSYFVEELRLQGFRWKGCLQLRGIENP